MTLWEKLKYRLGVVLSFRDPPTLPPHGWAYFDHMVAVFLTLNQADTRATALFEKARSRPYGVTWSDVFLLENIILGLQGEDEIRRRAWMLRERLRSVAGQGLYNQYAQSGVPNAADASLPTLRADLARVLDLMHWYYALIPMRERIRKRLTVQCILIVAFYMALLLVVLYGLDRTNHPFVAMSCCVIFFGMMGGFVSSQRRMQKIPTDGDPLVGVFGLENAGYYLWLSPLLGSIFAAVLALLFMGGILQGTVFPEFTKACDTATHSMFNPGCLSLPNCALDYAKLFVWCFLAGFAEQLVPDSLDRLTSKLDTGRQSSVPVAPTLPNPNPNELGKKDVVAATPVDKSTLDDALETGKLHDDENEGFRS